MEIDERALDATANTVAELCGAITKEDCRKIIAAYIACAKAAEQPDHCSDISSLGYYDAYHQWLTDGGHESISDLARRCFEAGRSTKRESVDLKDAEIAAWRTLANAKERVKWRRGFPTDGGMYLVRLADGEMCVTPWNDGKGKNKDSWGDDRKTGWTCLTDSQSTVKAWINVEDLRTLPCDPLISQEQGRRG